MITLEEIKVLHKKHAPTDELFELVYTHCVIVSEIAQQLMEKSSLSINADLVTAGCLLHDIGVYRLYKNGALDEPNYIQHGILGYELLKEEGLSEELCRFASHHTGVGISKEDITNRNLPLPLADYFAETDEELLVMYADKFHSKKEPPEFNSVKSYKAKVLGFGPSHLVAFEDMITRFGVPNLQPLSQKYGHHIN